MTATESTTPSPITLRPARVEDTGLIVKFIRGLAEYERLESEMVATESMVRATLFEAERPTAEVVLAFIGEDEPAGFATYFHNYSTFLGRSRI